jgi:hypothetical protein
MRYFWAMESIQVAAVHPEKSPALHFTLASPERFATRKSCTFIEECS